MKYQGWIIIAALVMVAFVAAHGTGVAEEGTDFNPYIGMKENLLKNIGKRITVRLNTGEPLEGSIVKVGEQNVHLSRLSGRDYYDAIVRIDRIDAIIFRAR